MAGRWLLPLTPAQASTLSIAISEAICDRKEFLHAVDHIPDMKAPAVRHMRRLMALQFKVRAFIRENNAAADARRIKRQKQEIAHEKRATGLGHGASTA